MSMYIAYAFCAALAIYMAYLLGCIVTLRRCKRDTVEILDEVLAERGMTREKDRSLS